MSTAVTDRPARLRRRPLRKTDIARAMGWNKSYLSGERFKGMPDFYAMEDFKAWYAATSPRAAPMNAGGEVSVVGGGTDGREKKTPVDGKGGRPYFDLARWDVDPEDFDIETVKRAERVVSTAYGLFELASETGDVAAAFGAVKNFGESVKQASAAKASYLDMLERQGKLLPLDDVMDVVGGVLTELRGQISRLGARVAASANPGDPALAQRVIEAEADRIFESVESAAKRIEENLGESE